MWSDDEFYNEPSELAEQIGKLKEGESGMSNIVNIGTEHIHPHPENPRKDLGDLTELAESVKKKGVMQNLTVIPGHWDEKQEWHEDGYTLIIGHRRCAAAKLAGLKELPCKVVNDMDKKDQVATMLEENMQRNDLTIWEQANGFQMMLDLGETEDSIAEKTGFSRTTIKHRLNIAKLNPKVLQEKEKDECFQLSLKDLYELEKIPDIRIRDKVLKESTSSNNLAQNARRTAKEVKRKEHEKAYIKICKKEGIEPAPKGAENERYSNKWEVVKEYELDNEVKDKIGCKTKAEKEKLFYVVYWGMSFAIIRKKEKKKVLSEYELKQKAQDKRKKEIKAMQKIMSAERTDFVKLAIKQKFKPEKEKPEAVMERLFTVLVKCGSWMNEQVMLKFITGKTYIGDDTDEEKAERAAYEKQRDVMGLLYKMMVYAVSSAADKELTEWNAAYRISSGEVIMELDEILASFGFSYSREEFYKLAEGSHDLFKEG